MTVFLPKSMSWMVFPSSKRITIVVPLFPAAILSKDKTPVRRWQLQRVGYGSRWQPVDAIITSGNEAFQATPLPYTDEEYNEHLTSDDWSREETDYFFILCQQFFHKFTIIAGNYEFPGVQRIAVDLRERYYSVIGKINALRTGNSDQLIYDKEGDRHRRLVMSNFQLREQEQIQEEILLANMMTKMRSFLPSVLQEREKLLLCCGGLGQHLLAHAPTLPELCGIMTKPKKGSTSEAAKPINKSSRKRKSELRRANPDVPLPPSDGDVEIYDGTYTGPGRKPKPWLAHTFARSTSLKPIRVGLTRHVDKLLQEMKMRTK